MADYAKVILKMKGSEYRESTGHCHLDTETTNHFESIYLESDDKSSKYLDR